MARQTKKVETIQEESVESQVKEVKKKESKKLTLDDDTAVFVKNNTPGGLIYVNHKTGDYYEWSNLGDEQELTLGDLKSMKARQIAFFKNRWIDIVSVPELDEQYTINDVYALLRVSQFYKELGVDFDIENLLRLDIKTIKEKVKNMSNSLKNAMIVIANDMILDGSLDSLSKITELEKILKVELARKENE